jgi:hypothetical protein
MFGAGKQDVKKLVSMAKTLGRGAVVGQIQSMLVPHVMEVFSKHGHGELRAAILQDYPLVRKHTPRGVRNALANIGGDPETRQVFQGFIVDTITPENVITWMENPDEWLEAAEAEEQRENLQQCADVLRETKGGEEWLNRQIWEIYRMAGITPEDTTVGQGND